MREEKGQGWQDRRGILSGVQTYMQRQREFPLRDFTERLDKHSRVISYGKGALVLYMPRWQIGDPTFFTDLCRFIRDNRPVCASWADLRRAFQQSSGQGFAWFFRQWVDDTGQSEISLAKSKVRKVSSLFHLELELRQRGKPKRLQLPVTSYGKDRSCRLAVALEGRDRKVALPLDFRPLKWSLKSSAIPSGGCPNGKTHPLWRDLSRLPIWQLGRLNRKIRSLDWVAFKNR